MLLFQKLKMLQTRGASAQPTVDGAVDREASLTRLAPEGASSNSVSFFGICPVLAFCFTGNVGYKLYHPPLATRTVLNSLIVKKFFH